MSYINNPNIDVFDPRYIMGIYKDFVAETTPEWHYCDCDGKHINPPLNWQATNPILKNIKTCTILPNAAPVFGSNPRGDGLTLDGSAGQVMVQIPAVYMDRWFEGDTEFIVFSPVPTVTPGGRSLILNPAFMQRGGYARSRLFVSRYYAGLHVKADGTLCVLSATGKQPWTGQEMVELGFTSGSVQPAVGDVLSGATSLVQGTVVAVKLESGTWGGGNAAGKIYLKMVDEKVAFDTGSVAFTVGQTVTGESSGATGTIIAVVVSSGSWANGDAAGYLVVRGGNGLNFTASKNLTDPLGGLAKTTTSTLGDVKASYTSLENLQILGSTVAVANDTGSILGLTCQNLEDYANKWLLTAGTDKRFGCLSVYTETLLSLLAQFDLGTCNVQSLTSTGAGCTSKPWTRRFGGVNNGADSINTNVDVWGTGKGTGPAGQTPMMWRGIQDVWGNVYGFVIGIQPNKDGVWNIIHPNGTQIMTHPLTTGTRISTINPCLMSDGYWGRAMNEPNAKWVLLPADVTGSNEQKRCDYYSYPRYAPGVLLVGGHWNGGASAGVACRVADYSSSNSYRDIGGRLEALE